MILRRRGEMKIFYCKCCQTKVKKEYNFCPECGHPFDGTVHELSIPEVISRTYKVCGECRWLDDEKTCIGYICKNPNKKWLSNTAPYHYKTTKACKCFEEKEM